MKRLVFVTLLAAMQPAVMAQVNSNHIFYDSYIQKRTYDLSHISGPNVLTNDLSKGLFSDYMLRNTTNGMLVEDKSTGSFDRTSKALSYGIPSGTLLAEFSGQGEMRFGTDFRKKDKYRYNDYFSQLPVLNISGNPFAAQREDKKEIPSYYTAYYGHSFRQRLGSNRDLSLQLNALADNTDRSGTSDALTHKTERGYGEALLSYTKRNYHYYYSSFFIPDLSLEGKMYREDAQWGNHRYQGRHEHATATATFRTSRYRYYRDYYRYPNSTFALIFQSRYDRFHEELENVVDSRRTSWVNGAGTEISYNYYKHFNVSTHSRLDYHSTYGWLPRPDIRLEFPLRKWIRVALISGRQFLVPNLFSNNRYLFWNDKTVVFTADDLLEKSWRHALLLNASSRNFTVSAAYSYQDWKNKVLADVWSDPAEIVIRSVKGLRQSTADFSVSFRTIKNRLSLSLLYRYDHYTTDLGNSRLQLPYYSRNSLFIHSYYTMQKNNRFRNSRIIVQAGAAGKQNLPGASGIYESKQRWLTSVQLEYPVASVIKGSRNWMQQLNINIGIDNILDQKGYDLTDTGNSSPVSGVNEYGTMQGRRVWIGIAKNL